MKNSTQFKSAKERVLETAYDLFYRQGYQGTGVNQIIAESGVAKATFYAHFPSKDALGVMYIRERERRERGGIREEVMRRKTPRDRFLGLAQAHEAWLRQTDFRGCGFANMAMEIPDQGNPIRREVRRQEAGYRALFREVTEDLVRSERRLQSLDIDQLSESYYLLIRGAIAASQISHDAKPILRALRTVRSWIE